MVGIQAPRRTAGPVPAGSRSSVAALQRARVPLDEDADSGVASQLAHKRSCQCTGQVGRPRSAPRFVPKSAFVESPGSLKQPAPI